MLSSATTTLGYIFRFALLANAVQEMFMGAYPLFDMVDWIPPVSYPEGAVVITGGDPEKHAILFDSKAMPDNSIALRFACYTFMLLAVPKFVAGVSGLIFGGSSRGLDFTCAIAFWMESTIFTFEYDTFKSTTQEFVGFNAGGCFFTMFLFLFVCIFNNYGPAKAKTD